MCSFAGVRLSLYKLQNVFPVSTETLNRRLTTQALINVLELGEHLLTTVVYLQMSIK
jgi:hypothetical protein